MMEKPTYKELEQRIQELEDTLYAYKKVLDNIPDHVVIQDLNHKILWANTAACQSLNHELAEVQGRYCHQLWYRDSAPCLNCPAPDAIRKESPTCIEKITEDGRIWRNRIAPLVDFQGKITRILEVTEDITETVKMRETQWQAEKHRELILNTMREMFAYYDLDLRVQWTNKASADSVGQTVDDLLGRHCYEIWQNRNAPCPLCPVLEAIRTDHSKEIETSTPDGRFYRIRGYPVHDEHGITIGAVECGFDITEAKHAEMALRESEKKFYKAFQSAPLLMTISSIDDGRFLEVNDAFVSLTGYSQEIAIGSTSTEIGFAQLRERNRMLEILKTKGRVQNLELNLNRADGTKMVCLYSAEIIDLDGQKKLLSTAIDISGRKQAEEALKESEKRFRTLIEAGPLSILLLREGKYVYGNPASARMLGYDDPDEIIGVSALEAIAPEYHEIVYKRIQNINQGKENNPIEIRLIKPNGEIAWSLSTSVSVVMDGKPTAIIMGQDITALKKAEQELDKAQTIQVALAKYLPAGMMMVDASTRKIESVNVYAASLFGAGIDEILGHKCHKYICPASEGECPICDLGQKIDNAEREIVLKDGGRLPVLKSVVSIIIEGREKLLEYFIDISDRKKAETELRESEEKYRKLVMTAPYGIQLTDRDGKIIFSNPAHHQIQGYDQGELIGKYIWELMADEVLRSKAKDYYQKIIKEQSEPEVYFNHDLTRDGRKIDVQVNWDYILNSEGEVEGIISIISDITKQKALESSIQQAQKMESIGNLAGGIAHDFNNILFPIIGMSEMLLEDLPPGSGERDNAEEIFKAGKRSSDLVKQILAFSRQSEHKMMPTRLQNILKEVISLSRSTIPTFIEINQDIEQDCGMVLSDPSQIHQIGMNIVTNAYHAIEDTGGTIFIKLKQTLLEDRESIQNNLTPGYYAVISISDTGHGMSKELIGKIFDPYFTTKQQGKGTGLGLAVVYGIVKEHNGHIKVYSEMGKGSTFEVYLPLMEKTGIVESTDSFEKYTKGNERILIVDDEEVIAKLEKQMLERMGYKVTYRLHSVEALEVFKAKPHAFDLVVTDMSMPNMPGDLLAKKIKSIRSDIPIIICTGFSERIHEDNIKQMGIDGLLMKPIVRSELAITIRKVLDKAKSKNQD